MASDERRRRAEAAVRAAVHEAAGRGEKILERLAGAWEELRALSHSLAGKAALGGQPAAGELARSLEDLLENGGPWGEVHPLAQRLLTELRRDEVEREGGADDATAVGEDGEAARGTLVVVDDDRELLELVAASFEEVGWQVVVAREPEEAERLLEQMVPDGILLDVQLPGESGFDLCARLQTRPHLREVPILFLTARSRPEDIVAGLSLGSDDYFIKPIEPGELVTRVITRVERVRSLLEKANRDALTGLANRRALEEELSLQMAVHRRERRWLGVGVVDIDHFKLVNDTYGHQAGDFVLRQVAARLSAGLRTTDRCGRWGGEEFLVVFPGTTEGVAFGVMERLRQGCTASPVPLGASERIGVTVSAGVSAEIPATDDWRALVARADEACYRAKALGRDRVESASSAG